MKAKLSLLTASAILATGISSAAFAESNNDNAISQYLTWAPTHDVYFEKISKPVYGLGLLQAKEKLPARGIAVGGELEVDPQVWHGDIDYSNNHGNGSSMVFSAADIDLMANINDWMSAFVKISNAGANQSSVALKRSFLLFGNLQQSPFYALIGQNNLPFGNFSPDAGPWSNGIDTNSFRPGETVKQLMFGYYNNGLKANAAVFQNQNSSTVTGAPNNRNINNFLLSTVYDGNLANGYTNYTVGAGYLNDLRYMNKTWGDGYDSTTSAAGNDFANSNGITDKRLPVLDLNAKVTFNNLVAFAAEFDKVLNHVTTTGGSDPSLNITNKAPYIWSAGAYYMPVIAGKQTTFWMGYAQAKNMQGLPMALSGNAYNDYDSAGIKHSLNAAISRSVFVDNNTISLDYQHVKDYAGKRSNTYTIDDSFYF
jgi:hypothetical protein